MFHAWIKICKVFLGSFIVLLITFNFRPVASDRLRRGFALLAFLIIVVKVKMEFFVSRRPSLVADLSQVPLLPRLGLEIGVLRVVPDLLFRIGVVLLLFLFGLLFCGGSSGYWPLFNSRSLLFLFLAVILVGLALRVPRIVPSVGVFVLSTASVALRLRAIDNKVVVVKDFTSAG